MMVIALAGMMEMAIEVWTEDFSTERGRKFGPLTSIEWGAVALYSSTSCCCMQVGRYFVSKM